MQTEYFVEFEGLGASQGGWYSAAHIRKQRGGPEAIRQFEESRQVRRLPLKVSSRWFLEGHQGIYYCVVERQKFVSKGFEI